MNVKRPQRVIDHLRSGKASLRFILRSLGARPPLVRVNALHALVNHARRDAVLVDEFRAAATTAQNQIRLMGTLSVAHVAVACLLRVGGDGTAEMARDLLDHWPEPDRTDLLWYLNSEGLTRRDMPRSQADVGVSCHGTAAIAEEGRG